MIAILATVLALARPEVKELFPGLWSRRLQEVQLHGLSRKAGARLVREVLGPQVPEAVVPFWSPSDFTSECV